MKEYIIQAYAQETIDEFDKRNAPELVRCKDCKHRTRRTCNNVEFWECNHIRYELVKCGVTDDWFCADGEKAVKWDEGTGH